MSLILSIVIRLFFVWLLFGSAMPCMAQSNATVLKGCMVYPDGGAMGYGYVYFLVSKEKIEIDSTGFFSFSISDPKHRVFYVSTGDANGRIFRLKSGVAADTIYKIVVPDIAYYVYYQKARVCPLCLESRNVKTVAYGLPSKGMTKLAKQEKIVLGGCVIPKNPPHCYCKKDDFFF